MTQEEQKWIDEKFKSMHMLLNNNLSFEKEHHKHVEDGMKKLYKNNEQVHDTLTSIYNEQRKTNGRVNTLEKATVVMRWLERQPKTAIFVLLVMLILLDFLNLGGRELVVYLKNIIL